MDVVQFRDLLLDLAANGTSTATTGRALNNARIQLLGEVIPLDPLTTTQADLAAASIAYPGYTNQTLTWNDPSLSESGAVEVVAEPVTFRPTSSDSVSTAVGFWLTNWTTGKAAMAGIFDDPIPMGDVLNQLIITPRWRPGSSADADLIS